MDPLLPLGALPAHVKEPCGVGGGESAGSRGSRGTVGTQRSIRPPTAECAAITELLAGREAVGPARMAPARELGRHLKVTERTISGLPVSVRHTMFTRYLYPIQWLLIYSSIHFRVLNNVRIVYIIYKQKMPLNSSQNIVTIVNVSIDAFHNLERNIDV